jgi:hypothetical protein
VLCLFGADWLFNDWSGGPLVARRLAVVVIDTNEDKDEVVESSFVGKDIVGTSILRLIY